MDELLVARIKLRDLLSELYIYEHDTIRQILDYYVQKLKKIKCGKILDEIAVKRILS